MPTQNVNLTPELEEFVKTQVSSGLYNSASEVHRAALASMIKDKEERDLRLARLRREVAIGQNDLDKGRFTELEDSESLHGHLEKLCDKALSETRVK